MAKWKCRTCSDTSDGPDTLSTFYCGNCGDTNADKIDSGIDRPIVARARTDDPSTSHEAAASMEVHLGQLIDRVRRHIYDQGATGATAEETSDALGVDKQSITPRFKSIIEKGFLIESGYERQNRSTRWALVRKHAQFRFDSPPVSPPARRSGNDSAKNREA